MNINKNNKGDIDFPIWWSNRIWILLEEYFRNKIPLVCIAIFSGYWVLPLLISSASIWAKSSSFITAKEYITNTYISDTTHLIFAMTISLAGTLCIYTLYQIPKTIRSLYAENVLNADLETIRNIYLQNRKIANSLTPKIISTILMLFTGYIFYEFYSSPDYKGWWGNINYSKLNLYFVIEEMIMVYFGTHIIYLFVINSKLLSDIIKLGFTPKLFHHDGSNGLSSLGVMIILKWLVAIFIILCVFIVIFFGYQGIERSLMTKSLIIIFSFSIPIIAIVPLLKSLKEITSIKEKKLKIFGKLLHENLTNIEQNASINKLENDKVCVNKFLEVYQIYTTVNNMNVFPFNPKALASVIILYTTQIAITIYQLLS